jgi:predicted NBD/HSP70 family sugar kinase
MYWGIDLGGTKIEGVVLQNDDPSSVLARQRISTEGHLGYDHVLDRIKTLVGSLREKVGQNPSFIGFGTPGTLDPSTRLLKNSNTLCLNNKPLDKDLRDLLKTEVALANDANCFTLAEYHMGVVKAKFPEARIVFGIIMGTGVGGGIVINGNILKGHHGIGGEWGHMWLDDSGEDCYCGHHGCVETIISGTALERYYLSLTGVNKKLKDILADHQDAHAQTIKQRLIHFFGKGVGQVINVIDPDVIIVGGGLSQIDFLYTEGAREVAKNIFNPVLNTPVVPPSLGDSAGVFGAAMLAIDI